MAKYLKNITSYSDLKIKYRDLLKANHPDNGGQLEVMQEINCEFDALFKIWKDRAVKENTLTEEEKKETASSTKRTFYTDFGWAGSRYDSNLSLKEISKIVKNYTKEKYPTCKFSVRTHYASMCQELSVDLLEFPEPFIKTAEQLKSEGITETKTYTDRDGNTQSYEDYTEEINDLLKKLHRNDYLPDSYYQEEIFTAYEKAVNDNKCFYGVKTEYFQSVVDDVNAFVQSYNYDDSDSMTDYFDNNFYFFNVGIDNCQVVAKTARIKNHESKPATTEEPKTAALETSETDYTITESEHTKTHEKIYLVKWLPDLSRDEYITLNNAIKKIGGYYSKFTHSFIFKDDPTEQLKTLKLA